MNNTGLLLFLQSLLSGLQFVNLAIAAIEHPPIWLSLTVGGLCAALSNYVQHAGNQATPKRVLESDELKKSAKSDD